MCAGAFPNFCGGAGGGSVDQTVGDGGRGDLAAEAVVGDQIGELFAHGLGKIEAQVAGEIRIVGNIAVEDDGSVMIPATSADALDPALQEIEALCAEIRVGAIYTGKVVSVKDFGAFIELAPGTDGMCHVSELDTGFVKNVSDVVKLGDMVKVKVILVDDQGRIKLSRKQAMIEDEKAQAEPVSAE